MQQQLYLNGLSFSIVDGKASAQIILFIPFYQSQHPVDFDRIVYTKFKMQKIDYYSVIHKYISPTSLLYPIYLTHCFQVTQRAIQVAERLELSEESLTFIEEASMLHDIGIVKVNAPEIHCYGELPYVCHGVEGSKILETEGLPQHALVAERHTGTGLSKADIIQQELPIPHRDMLAVSVEEEIISFADLFFSKKPHRLWREKRVEKVRRSTAKYGPEKLEILEDWLERFS